MAGANLSDIGALGTIFSRYQAGRAQKIAQNAASAQLQQLSDIKLAQANAATARAGAYVQHIGDENEHYDNQDGSTKTRIGNQYSNDGAMRYLAAVKASQGLPIDQQRALLDPIRRQYNLDVTVPGDPTGAPPSVNADGTTTPGSGSGGIASGFDTAPGVQSQINLRGAQQGAVNANANDKVYKTLSTMQPLDQAPYLTGLEAGSPNIKIGIPGVTEIGKRNIPISGPPMLADINAGAKGLPDAIQPIYQDYYRPGMDTQAKIDLQHSQQLINKQRLPLIASQTDLERIKVKDLPGLDQSQLGLRGAETKFYNQGTINKGIEGQYIAPLTEARIGSLDAGAAAANARAAASAGGIGGVDKQGNALLSQRRAIQSQLTNMLTQKNPFGPATVIDPSTLTGEFKHRYDTLKKQDSDLNTQLYNHIRQRNSAPPSGGGASQHTGLSGQSTEGLTGSVTVPGGHSYGHLRPEFATGLTSLMAAANQAGIPLGMTDGFRSYAEQVELKRRKPTLAAKPGTSNHGWGTAADLSMANGSSITPQAAAWIRQNAPRFGLNIPMTGADGGKNEPWHVELNGGAKHLPANPSNAQMMDNMASNPGAPTPTATKHEKHTSARARLSALGIK
jgi:hypothetical protein